MKHPKSTLIRVLLAVALTILAVGVIYDLHIMEIDNLIEQML